MEIIKRFLRLISGLGGLLCWPISLTLGGFLWLITGKKWLLWLFVSLIDYCIYGEFEFLGDDL